MGDGLTALARQLRGEFLLFWAVRGGGGNFGVVTRFRYRLHPIGAVLGAHWPCRQPRRSSGA
jgi:FAD/FMN-containing dehydrogenase